MGHIDPEGYWVSGRFHHAFLDSIIWFSGFKFLALEVVYDMLPIL